MKKKVLFAVLMIVSFMLVTISSAIGETDINSVKSTLFAYLIDDYVKKEKYSCFKAYVHPSSVCIETIRKCNKQAL